MSYINRRRGTDTNFTDETDPKRKSR